MEGFFIDDEFYLNIEEFICDYFEDDKDSVNALEEDWTIKIELSDLEPIFRLDAEILCQILADTHEDRLTEDFHEESKILKALNESIDFEKLEKTLPNLYYANGKFDVLTKKDLLENI